MTYVCFLGGTRKLSLPSKKNFRPPKKCYKYVIKQQINSSENGRCNGYKTFILFDFTFQSTFTDAGFSSDDYSLEVAEIERIAQKEYAMVTAGHSIYIRTVS